MAKVPTVFGLTLVSEAHPPKIVGTAVRVAGAGLNDMMNTML